MTKSLTQVVSRGQDPAGPVPRVGPAEAHAAERAQGLRLWRGTDGRLWGRSDAEPERRAVRVCRLFPWTQPAEYVSLRDADDEELALVRDPSELDPKSRSALELSLAEAGFVMEIVGIDSIEEEIEIRAWRVQTRQGPRSFQTVRDEWPLEMPGGGLLVRDVAGDLFFVPDPSNLDSNSRDLLWAYAD